MTDKKGGMRDVTVLYERYAKPLERDHMGEFVAVSYDGQVLLDSNLYELVIKASKAFGPKNHIFKLGERAVGKWL